GLTGLWLLKIVLLALCAALLWRALGLYGIGAAGRGLGLMVWALALDAANDIRPENFSLLFFILLWIYSESRRLGKLKDPGLGAEICGFAVFFALWANFHPGFLYGLALAALFAIGRSLRERSSLPMLIIAAGTVGALANPHAGAVYTVPWRHLKEMRDLTVFINEWRQASILQVSQWPFWALFTTAYAAVIFRWLLRRDVPFEHIAALLLLGLSSARHVRTTAYFSAAAVPIAAAALAGFSTAKRGAVLRRVLFAAGILSAGAFFATALLPALRSMQPFNYMNVPHGAVPFLAANRKALGRLKMFNTWHWGGYLGFRLYPDYPVFVDGRYIFHPLLRPKYRATKNPEAFKSFLGNHKVDLVVIARSTRLRRSELRLPGGQSLFVMRPFYVEFLPVSDWGLVYWDKQGYVFVRRSAVEKSWLRKREYRWFRPDDLTSAQLLLRAGKIPRAALAAEVGRFAGWTPNEGDARAAQFWLKTVLAPVPGTR
ncbi:MAG: hypothetical protein V3S11_05230, partial [Elusimicrobiota bacterium]